MNGPELLMKSMGLGPAIEAVKALVDQGALQKILAFSEEIGELTNEVRTLRRKVQDLEDRLVASGTVAPGSDAGIVVPELEHN